MAMKFIASTTALLKQLQVINGVIGTRTVIPILEYFLFEVEDGRLVVTGTDLEVSMRSSLAIEAKDSGRIAVPSKLIIDILKTLPEQPVTFTINAENKTVELTTHQ
jgi:DNA polymerase III subunit beta